MNAESLHCTFWFLVCVGTFVGKMRHDLYICIGIYRIIIVSLNLCFLHLNYALFTSLIIVMMQLLTVCLCVCISGFCLTVFVVVVVVCICLVLQCVYICIIFKFFTVIKFKIVFFYTKLNQSIMLMLCNYLVKGFFLFCLQIRLFYYIISFL